MGHPAQSSGNTTGYDASCSKGPSRVDKSCALEVAAPVRELSYPVAYIASIPGETLRVLYIVLTASFNWM